ncbi:MAG: efflux RND transporter periplasmic adaptor subunit [Pseudomonadota bacterium]
MAIDNRRAALALLSGMAAVLLAGCEAEEEGTLAAPLRSVKVQKVEAAGAARSRVFSGTVSSAKETSLSFRVSGRVIEKNVSVSDAVKKGQTLARLDPAPFELEVQRAVAALAEARSSASNARSSYERTKRLYEAGNSSRENLDNARTALTTATAQSSSQAKALELAQLDLKYTNLVSDDTCGIAATDLQVGENVQQGQQVILANCGDRLEVDLGIPERFISLVKQDDSVGVTFPALPNLAVTGTIDDVGISATSGGTTFPVTIALPQEVGPQVKAGLSAQVTFLFQVENGAEALMVPSFAVGEDQSGRFVFVLEPGGDGTGIVRRRPVETGPLDDAGIEILSGIEDGSLVVTAGVSALRDGLKVSLPNG